MDAAPVHTAQLAACPPFALGASLRALSGFAPCAGDQTVTGDRVRKALTLSGGPVVVEVAPAGTEPGVTLIVFADRGLAPGEPAEAELAVRRWLSLDDDLTPLLDLADRDPAMAPILAATRGLHQVRFASLAEGAVYFTLTQRTAEWQAAARKRRIAAALGSRLVVDGVTYVAFPDFATLMGADLSGFAGGAQRADRLVGVVDGIAALDEDWLRTAPYPEARQALLDIRGVGAFTANAVLLRVLGRPDDVPLEMTQFQAVTREVYGPRTPAPAELRDWYGGYVGWWAYLCRTGLSWLDRTAGVPLASAA
jgi:DNA-3-methyladenine glycosylase II